MPNLVVIRPADANETAYAWKFALEYTDGPVAICLSRQGLLVIDQQKYGKASNLDKGAYAVVNCDKPDVLLLATGSEVAVAIAAAEKLAAEGTKARVVSMPSWELFDRQSQEYRDSVLPPSVKARVAVEAAMQMGWSRWLGCQGKFIGLATFGESAPAKAVFAKFGITPENVIKTAKEVITRCK
jgi:transketolase